MIVTVNHDGRVLATEIVQGWATPAGPPGRSHRHGLGPVWPFGAEMRKRPTRSPWCRASSSPATRPWKPRCDDGPPDQYCVMGNPVEHSRSPWIHARFAELTGQALHYERRLVPLDGFAQALHAFAAAGAGLQHHRALQARSCAGRHAPQRARATWPAPPTPSPSRTAPSTPTTPTAWAWWPTSSATQTSALPGAMLLIGAGGAAAGALGPLLAAGPRSITVANRTPARAQALAQSHAPLALLQKQSCLRNPQAQRPISILSLTPRPAAWRAAKCLCPQACCAPAAWPTT